MPNRRPTAPSPHRPTASLDRELAQLPRLAINEVTNKNGELLFKSEDSSGATALVALVTPENLIVANAGDCKAVVIQPSATGSGAWGSLCVSLQHKPDLPTERARIEASGATVEKNENDGPEGPARINGG